MMIWIQETILNKYATHAHTSQHEHGKICLKKNGGARSKDIQLQLDHLLRNSKNSYMIIDCDLL